MGTQVCLGELKQFVFIVPDLSTGGGERVAFAVAQEFAKSGYGVTILTKLGPRQPANVYGIAFNDLNWGNKWQAFSTISSAFRNSTSGTVFVAVLTGPILLANLINVLYGVPLLSYEHSDIERLHLNRGGTIGRKVLELVTATLFRRSSWVGVVSPYLREQMVKRFKCDPKRVAFIPNPVCPFLDKLRPTAVIGDDNSRPITAYLIGRASREKRLDQAVALLSNSYLVSEIVLVSDISVPSRRYDGFKRLAGTKAFRVINSYSELGAFNRRRSVLLNLSRAESYSLVIAEWLASGLKVISVPTPNLLSLWSRINGCHFLQDTFDEADVDKLIEHAFCDESDNRDYFRPVPVSISTASILKLIAREN